MDCEGPGGDKQQLHDGVVERDEVGEEVQVPRHKHHQEKNLRFPGYSGTAPSLPYLEEE